MKDTDWQRVIIDHICPYDEKPLYEVPLELGDLRCPACRRTYTWTPQAEQLVREGDV